MYFTEIGESVKPEQPSEKELKERKKELLEENKYFSSNKSNLSERFYNLIKVQAETNESYQRIKSELLYKLESCNWSLNNPHEISTPTYKLELDIKEKEKENIIKALQVLNNQIAVGNKNIVENLQVALSFDNTPGIGQDENLKQILSELGKAKSETLPLPKKIVIK